MRISNNGNVSIGTAGPAKNKLTVKGSMAVSKVTANTNYTITPNDYIVEFSALVSATLPLSTTVDEGTLLILRNRAGGGAVTINRAGTDTIQLLGSSATSTSASIPAFNVLRLYLSGGTWIEW